MLFISTNSSENPVVVLWLLRYVCKTIFETRAAESMAIHCIIHQQALGEKISTIYKTTNLIVRIVNYIRQSAFSHHQFKNCLTEIICKYQNIPYHYEVLLRSRGNIL